MSRRVLAFLIALHQVAACTESGSGGADSAAPASEAGPGTDASRPDTGTGTRADAAVTPHDAAPTSRDAASEDGGAPAEDAAPSDPPPKTCTGTARLPSYVSDPKLCVYTFASDVAGARQLAFAPNGDLFVSNGRLTVLWDADGSGTSDGTERATFAQAAGLNHGVVFSRDGAFVYASSASTVFRWAYTPGQRMASAEPTVVVDGIPGGGHDKRPLAFDSKGRLILSIGSASNLDTTEAQWSSRSLIRRYTLPDTIPAGGLTHDSGELVAFGMRNESGIFVDTDDRIWGVENGRDNLRDDDLGGDIHNDNPGEELNLIDGREPKFYGYPLCFSEHTLSGGGGPGTQWADEDGALGDDRVTDAFCQDATKVRPPKLVMPAHWAPLGIIRYTGRSLPMHGDLIIGAHGSWNRQPATGRVVARVRVQGDTLGSLEVLVGESSGGQLRQGEWDARPVDIRQGPDQAVYVSDDLGGRVLKIGYEQ